MRVYTGLIVLASAAAFAPRHRLPVLKGVRQATTGAVESEVFELTAEQKAAFGLGPAAPAASAAPAAAPKAAPAAAPKAAPKAAPAAAAAKAPPLKKAPPPKKEAVYDGPRNSAEYSRKSQYEIGNFGKFDGAKTEAERSAAILSRYGPQDRTPERVRAEIEAEKDNKRRLRAGK